jgi:hypothetical protein
MACREFYPWEHRPYTYRPFGEITIALNLTDEQLKTLKGVLMMNGPYHEPTEDDYKDYSDYEDK